MKILKREEVAQEELFPQDVRNEPESVLGSCHKTSTSITKFIDTRSGSVQKPWLKNKKYGYLNSVRYTEYIMDKLKVKGHFEEKNRCAKKFEKRIDMGKGQV